MENAKRKCKGRETERNGNMRERQSQTDLGRRQPGNWRAILVKSLHTDDATSDLSTALKSVSA